MALAPGMALGFFNLGPQTHMSGEIGVPSFLGGFQNLGDPPLRNSLCCCYENEWLANYCHTVNKAWLSFFCLKTLTLALKCFCWSETFAELLWSTWLVWRTSAGLWKFCIHLWTRSSFQLFCNLYKSSVSHCLSLFVCSYPNSFSHLSNNWLCLPPFSWFIAVLQAHVSGHFTSTIDQTMNKHGRAHSSFPDV